MLALLLVLTLASGSRHATPTVETFTGHRLRDARSTAASTHERTRVNAGDPTEGAAYVVGQEPAPGQKRTDDTVVGLRTAVLTRPLCDALRPIPPGGRIDAGKYASALQLALQRSPTHHLRDDLRSVLRGAREPQAADRVATTRRGCQLIYQI